MSPHGFGWATWTARPLRPAFLADFEAVPLADFEPAFLADFDAAFFADFEEVCFLDAISRGEPYSSTSGW